MKNTLNRINSRLETLEENTHELDGLWRKTTRNEALREKRRGNALWHNSKHSNMCDWSPRQAGNKNTNLKISLSQSTVGSWLRWHWVYPSTRDDSWDHWLPRPPTRWLLIYLRVLVFLSAVCCNFCCRGFAHFWSFFLSILCFRHDHKWGCVLASRAPITKGYKLAHNKRNVFTQFWRPSIPSRWCLPVAVGGGGWGGPLVPHSWLLVVAGRAGALDLQTPHSRLCLHPHEVFALPVQQHPFAFWAHLAPVRPCLLQGYLLPNEVTVTGSGWEFRHLFGQRIFWVDTVQPTTGFL